MKVFKIPNRMNFETIKTELAGSKVQSGKYIGISETTQKKYLQKLNYLFDRTNVDGLLDLLNSFDNINSRITYFTAVIGANKHSPTFSRAIESHFKSINEAYMELLSENKENLKTEVKSEREKAAWVDWKNILAETPKAPKAGDSMTQEQVLLAIYTLIPPVRLDYHALSIVQYPATTQGNYLQIQNKNKMSLILTEYKTSETYGATTIALPVRLCKIINSYLETMPKKKFLFSPKGSIDKSFKSAESFGAYLRDTLKTIFEKPLTIDILRHSYITWLKRNDVSLAKKKKSAKIMGHSLEMQEAYVKE